MTILSQILFDGPTAPFYEAFIESGFAPAFSPGNGYDFTTKEATFSIGVSHVPIETKVSDVEEKINETLKTVIENGINKEHFESILHSVVFNQKLTKDL